MGGAHAEDVGEDGDVGGEGEVVVGYSQGHGQALDRLIAKQAFTSTVKRDRWEGRGRTGQDKTEQNKHREGERERERPGVNLICRAWHAVEGTSNSAALHLTGRSHCAICGIMQEVLSLPP